jgi:hypothetical protein
VSSANKLVGLIFSKDRAMQLDAVLRSFFLHCKDRHLIDMKVLYTTSNSDHERQYHQLLAEYPSVQFIKETSFRIQLLQAIKSYRFILFLVDDCLFVRDFSLHHIRQLLAKHYNALGFSLRLGINTQYNYNRNKSQPLPRFRRIANGILKYNWRRARSGFAYPLEVSSSVYRVKDLLPYLSRVRFSNPNTLEAKLSWLSRYIRIRTCLLCYRLSVAFCNPLNRVQTIYSNRAGANPSYSIPMLSRLYDQGYRIDVKKYTNFTPNSCHQEVKPYFFQMQPK